MEIPSTIGKYEVLERIGRGGFGVVYKGRDPFIKRLVAVKVCTSTDETLKRRFLREAEIAGNLHHRNIVTVFEFGYDDAGPFLAQELLSGEDLEAKIRQAVPLGEDVRLGYLLQIARALEYAHKKGILHRDVKPSNVRVLDDDRIKILDFGIAKLSGAETQLTRSGRVMGTAGYLSPEQIKGEPVDARSDVFSFGVLAYELLTFVHPFPGTTISELLHGVVRSQPRPLAVVWPECPPEIAAMVGRCLEKDPEQRYPSFSEVAETIASVLAELRDETGDSRVLPAPSAPTVESLPPPEPTAPLRRPPPQEDDTEATQEAPPLPGPKPGAEPGEGRARRIPFGSRRPLSSQGRRLVVAGAVLVASAALALALAWRGSQILHAVRTAEPVETRAVAPPIEAPAAEGVLVVDAVPWGEVIRVTGPGGRSVPLSADGSTPLVLPLEPGTYTVEVSNPESLESRMCRVDLEPSGTGRCSIEFYRLEAVEYFQEAGWWE